MRTWIWLSIGLLASDTVLADGRVFAPATHDAHVVKNAPSTTHPYAGWLKSGLGPSADEVYRTFVRFPLPAREQIVSATLRANFINATSSSGPGVQIIDFVADDAWSELTLTWNDQPDVTNDRIAIIPNGEASPFHEMSFDVTELAQREQALDGELSIRVAGLDERLRSAANWRSRGDTYSRGFYLELVVDPAPRLEPGDVVTLSAGGLFTGLVAIDPERQTQKAIAPMRLVWFLGGLAIDARDGSWVTDDWSGLIRIDPLSGNPTPIADAPPVTFVQNHHLAMRDGTIFATSWDPVPSIRRVDADTGAEEALVSGAPLCQPTGLAIAGDALLVADLCGALIHVALEDGTPTVVPVAGGLHAPEGVAVDAAGHALVADRDGETSGRILRIDPVTGASEVVTSLPFVPGPIAIDPAGGTIWVGSYARCSYAPYCYDSELGRVDPVLGTYTQAARWSDAMGGMTLDGSGAPLVTLTYGGDRPRIVRVDPATGAERTVAAPLGVPDVFWPEDAHWNLFFESSGRLLLATDDRILRIDPATGRQSIAAIGAPMACPFAYCVTDDATLAPDGRVLMLRTAPSASLDLSLLWVDPRTGASEQRAFDPYFFGLDDVAVERSGDVLLADSRRTATGTSWIYRMDRATGALSVVATSPPLGAIGDMILDASGAIVVGDEARGEVLRVDPVSGAGELVAAGRMAPSRIALDASGRIASWGRLGSQEILSLADPDSGEIVTLATHPELPGYRTVAVFQPACANGIDDDQDGRVDLADAGCANAAGRREDPPCDNGLDDDRDGRIDVDDPSCTSAASNEVRCGMGAELALLLAGVRCLHARASKRGSRVPS